MIKKGDVAAALMSLNQAWTPGSVEQVRRLCMISGFSQAQTKKVVSEIFSPPRVSAQIGASSNGPLCPGTSFDLKVTSETGEKWNFLLVADRRACWRRLVEEDPWVVIGSPPCIDYCASRNWLRLY